jgi:hypothetical protein
MDEGIKRTPAWLFWILSIATGFLFGLWWLDRLWRQAQIVGGRPGKRHRLMLPLCVALVLATALMIPIVLSRLASAGQVGEAEVSWIISLGNVLNSCGVYAVLFLVAIFYHVALCTIVVNIGQALAAQLRRRDAFTPTDGTLLHPVVLIVLLYVYFISGPILQSRLNRLLDLPPPVL